MKPGIKLWTTNEEWFEEANRLYEKEIINYVELYTVPGSYEGFDFEKLKMQIVIHGPHYGHGFNMADKSLFDSNMEKLKETLSFADKLNSKQVIFHPGFGGGIENTKYFLKQIKDNRIILENVPKKSLVDGEIFVAYNIKEFRELLKIGNLGFCLDFGHAAKSALSQGKDYKEAIQNYLKFNPNIFHICGADLSNEKDKHLNLWEGDLDASFLKKCIGKEKRVTFEVPKKGSSLENDIKNINYFNEI